MKTVKLWGIASLAVCLAVQGGVSMSAWAGTLKLTITERDSKDPVPCRVCIHPPGNPGKPVYHQVCEGNVTRPLPPGEYVVVVRRGPDYRIFEKTVQVAEKDLEIAVQIERLANLPALGWYGGDMHVHCRSGFELMGLNVKAEDLNVSLYSSWHNKNGPKGDPPTAPVEVEPGRVIQVMTHEIEGGPGCIFVTNLKKPLDGKGNVYARMAAARKEGAWVDSDRPCVNGVPRLLAMGALDSVGLLPNTLPWGNAVYHNFHTRKGVTCWGLMPKDRIKTTRQAGFWFLDCYYEILNHGFRIPPSAGTAFDWSSKVGLGYNRVYVHIDGDFSLDAWWKNFKAGRVFVTNGPILLVTANEKLPGEIFRSPSGDPLSLKLSVKIAGNDPLESVDIVQDGKVIQRIRESDLGDEPAVDPVTFTKSGWVHVRAVTSMENTFRAASTGPFYVEVGEAPASAVEEGSSLKWVTPKEGPLRLEKYATNTGT